MAFLVPRQHTLKHCLCEFRPPAVDLAGAQLFETGLHPLTVRQFSQYSMPILKIGRMSMFFLVAGSSIGNDPGLGSAVVDDCLMI